MADVRHTVMAGVGGMNVTRTVEGRERYSVNARYARELRDDSGAIGREGRWRSGYPRVVSAGAGRPWAWPRGWERANRTLRVVVRITLLIILLLLYINFRNVTESLIVMASVPFALVGSVWLLWALGYNLSVAVWVGLIALAGVAAEIAVILLVYLDQAYERHRREGRLRNRAELLEAVREGAGERVRPVLMTATAVIGGLLPIMWGGGTGATVMKRIAAPMVGGMVSATLLTLLVVPALYSLWREWQLRGEWEEGHPTTAGEPVP